jgi:hypothetical protein
MRRPKKPRAKCVDLKKIKPKNEHIMEACDGWKCMLILEHKS